MTRPLVAPGRGSVTEPGRTTRSPGAWPAWNGSPTRGYRTFPWCIR